jgi:MFS family permease
MSSASATHTKTASFAAPFRHAAFTVIWTATVVSNVGGWMYSAASGWLMTSLDPDPLIVALVQAASSLPICLLAIPAGALADIFDKRKYVITVESLYTVLAAVYAAMVGLGLANPGNLLAFTLILGAAGALTSPARLFAGDRRPDDGGTVVRLRRRGVPWDKSAASRRPSLTESQRRGVCR